MSFMWDDAIEANKARKEGLFEGIPIIYDKNATHKVLIRAEALEKIIKSSEYEVDINGVIVSTRVPKESHDEGN